MNIKYNITSYNFLSCGDRRLNILVTGELTYVLNNMVLKKNFCEFIHLGFGNDKKYWIPSMIMKII